MDRESHRAAVEAGYASLAEYIETYGAITMEKPIPSIQFYLQNREAFRITAEGQLLIPEGSTIDDASKALFDALGNGLHKLISDMKADNERYRKALLDCLYVLGRDGAIDGSLRVIEIVDTALQQKESE